jgi:hypothetical protein
MNSRVPFDESDASLCRIDTLSIVLPCTVASLKAHIVNVEGIANQKIQLFQDTNGEVLMNDTNGLPLFAETFSGCLEDDPLAVFMVQKC